MLAQLSHTRFDCFLCSAGWSADSGLAVYKDVADVAAYRDLGLTYRDLCVPSLLESDAARFHGFWASCFNDYRDTSPHEGYGIVAAWRKRLHERTEPEAQASASDGDVDVRSRFFCFTSNVDAHSLLAFPLEEVYECHGNSELWQCASPRCATALKKDSVGDEAVAKGRWRAPQGLRFHIDAESRLAPTAPQQPAARGCATAQQHDSTCRWYCEYIERIACKQPAGFPPRPLCAVGCAAGVGAASAHSRPSLCRLRVRADGVRGGGAASIDEPCKYSVDCDSTRDGHCTTARARRSHSHIAETCRCRLAGAESRQSSWWRSVTVQPGFLPQLATGTGPLAAPSPVPVQMWAG